MYLQNLLTACVLEEFILLEAHLDTACVLEEFILMEAHLDTE